MRVLQWLGILEADRPASDAQALAAIEAQLESLDPARARFLACFAYLLGRVARADHDVSDVEAQEMARLVAERAALPAEQTALVVEIATAHGLRFGGTDDFLIAREFGALASPAEKLALLDCLFAVSAADRAIRNIEDNEIRRIAAELQIGHQEYIAVRAAHAAHLDARRRSPDPDRV
ncbi:MAG: TerB family tellurite resistance protein [Acidobacteria bacterium]|nr:TerB family tellurite resistance protein [Acidobacteriota bacterium]